MKYFWIILIVAVVALGGLIFYGENAQAPVADEPTVGGADSMLEPSDSVTTAPVGVQPISHATVVLEWNGQVIYVDPVGGSGAFTNQPTPDLVLLTDIHSDHLSVETLEAVTQEATTIMVPPAVEAELPEVLAEKTTVIENGDEADQESFAIRATAMYNLPQEEDAFHPKGRGNGYVLEANDTRVYIAGDTEDIPEMRELENIDLAFVPMNTPYTMGVESAADGVLAFAPEVVYPYHFRNEDGSFSDLERFRELVNQENSQINVILADWYPDTEEDGV